MTHSVKGVVDDAYTKQKENRDKTKTFNINYIDVDGTTISTGFKKLFSKGELVDITVEQKFNEWQYVKHGGDGLPAATGAATAKPKAVQGNFGKDTGFPIDPKSSQMSIIRQSSMNRAVEIMDQLVNNGIIENPATKEEYMDMLMEIALEIADFGSGADITGVLEMHAAKEAQRQVVGGD